MTDKVRITKPFLDGTVTEYLDTGSGMVSQGVITRMLASTDRTTKLPSDSAVSYPNTHTLRLRIELPEARAIDRLVIEGVNQASGLSYVVSRGDGSTMAEIVPSTSISPVDSGLSANILVRVDSPVSATTYDIDITGFTQSLQIEGVMIGSTHFIPTYNFNNGSSFGDNIKVSPVKAASGYLGNTVDRARTRQLTIANMPVADYRALTNFYNHELVRGYCLFEQDQTTDIDWFLSTATLGGIAAPHFESFTAQMSFNEINENQ